MPAGMAAAAINLGFNGYFLSFVEFSNVFPHFSNFSGHLVALCDRVGGKGMFSMIDMDV